MQKCLVTSLCLLFLTCLAGGDYIELPVKWSQTPWDPEGTAWLSDHTMGQVVADDFICDDPAPLVAVRWWGSYPAGVVVDPSGMAGPFDISFHSSRGAHPYSWPGSLITVYTVEAQEVLVGLDAAGTRVYRYDAYLPEPFDQWSYSQASANKGELFLDICKPTNQGWGWREVIPPHPITDFATRSHTHTGPWSRLTTDMAFEVMIIPEPTTLMLLALGAAALLRRRNTS